MGQVPDTEGGVGGSLISGYPCRDEPQCFNHNAGSAGMKIFAAAMDDGETGGLGLLIETVPSIESTNSELLQREPLLPAGSSAAALWLVARRQTGGRGRRLRPWLSAPGASLTASFGREVGSASRLGPLSLVAGVAVAETLAAFGADVRLKWPNDVWMPAGKAGGILCEARARGPLTRIVIGCGLNLLRPAGVADLDQPVAGLFDPASVPDADELGALIGRALLVATDQLLEEGFMPFRPRWQARDLLRSRAVRVQRDGSWADATALGVDDDGALLVAMAGEPGRTRRILADEVSVRPAGLRQE